LGIGAVENGDVIEGEAVARDVFEDAIGDKFGFLFFALGDEDANFFTGATGAPEFFFVAVGVVFDEGVGRLENGVGAPVVLVEEDGFCAGEISFEVEDVLVAGTTPGVD